VAIFARFLKTWNSLRGRAKSGKVANINTVRHKLSEESWLWCKVIKWVSTIEYTEHWPCPLFDILLKKYFPAG
jgi:hypothetical protein